CCQAAARSSSRNEVGGAELIVRRTGGWCEHVLAEDNQRGLARQPQTLEDHSAVAPEANSHATRNRCSPSTQLRTVSTTILRFLSRDAWVYHALPGVTSRFGA